ncbi:MAG TPA: M14 family metallopeptidase [Vicinamibacterales bacterium]|nr:M14 family metallopeptidase [Vicinamibacterales bacterium]
MNRVLLLFVVALSAGAVGRTAPGDAVAPASLSAFFKTGAAFQDRNGDGVVDFVDARIVLAERPSATEVAAAADVAARLGYETTAINLPLDVVRGRQTNGRAASIFVGARSLAQASVTADAIGAGVLKAGEGAVAAFTTAGTPAVAVLGGDDEGLTAAAVMLAGHLPNLWDQKGPNADTVAEDVAQFLAGKGVTASSTSVPVVYVRAGGDGVERVVAVVQLANGGDLVKAQVALNQFKATGTRDAKRALSYAKVRSLQIRLRAPGSPSAVVDVPRAAATDADASQPPGRRPGGGTKENLDLSTFYAIDGALADSDNNLIPDRVDVLLSADGEGTDGVVDLAARLGLESTGVSVPIAKTAKLITSPESEPILVLIGTAHPVVEQLIEKKKMERPSLQAGEGLIQLVKKAFGEKSAIVVTGGDAAGVNRAVHQLAETFPHIWQRGKDRTTLDDVEDDVRKFVAGRSPAGQAAMSLYKLEKLADQVSGKELASANVKVFVEKADPRLADLVKETAAARITAPSLTVDVQSLDVQKARALVSDEFDIPSEVDDFWTKFRTRVIPAVKRRAAVSIEARVSEPPEVRRQIEQQARAELIKAGADDKSTTVTVLSAYKQGYSWLYDVVRPELSGKAIDRLTIRFAEIGPPAGWKQQGMFAPTRWLLELYPIDEILASELKIDLAQIRFEMAPIGSPAYEVVATAKGGGELLLRKTFEPAVVERAFFDRFPDYERVRVTTGWIKADVGGKSAIDERIATDPERFWDRFQSKTLPALYDHVMALGNGKPRAEDAPFFGELTVDLTLSEPEYRLPIDQEQISSMEALHEEIYFNTLHFFDVMGRFTRGAPLTYPGRVIPLMHPKGDGKAGHAKISITGFDASRPAVVVDYVERSGKKGAVRLDVPKVAVERPQTLAATVRAGKDGVERLDLRVKVDTEKDERETLIQRTDERRVDTSMMSAEQVRAVLASLSRLRGAGLYRDALAYHDLGSLRLTIAWEHESKPATEIVATLESNGTPAAFPDIRAATNTSAADAARRPPASAGGNSEPLVQWDTPIPPPEAADILARMSSFKEATVYKVGQSYLGKDVWAMDLMPPIEASHWSQAKQTTMKPTIVYSARQHANEVSSTSHVLKMAELLLTDPAFKEKLKKVNVVVHPITNADGAQLAYDLQKVNPTYMLHAGYLGALGVDVTSAQWDPDPLYPESGIRPKIWRTWLPDIFLNPHGYPSHEWVQLFSEYAAWVRTRSVETRDYWTMRGWWMPGFGWLDDARYPRHKDEQMKLLTMITDYAKQAPGTVALNERAYARYKRYSFDFDQKNFKLDFTNGVLIYKSIKGARANPQSQDFMTRNPNVTIWDGVTEAPDETARGDWLKLVANAGLQWDKAILEYLVQGHHEVERTVTPFWNGAALTMNRPRPPKPPASETQKTTTQASRQP